MSLAEVIVALGISGIIAAGALSAFLMIGRSGVRAANYTLQYDQAGRALELLAGDLRMASGITWNSSSSITLTVPDNYTATGNRVTYAWDTNPASVNYRCLYQMPGGAADGNPRRVLVRDITSLGFSRFDRLDAATTNDAQTKRLRVSMTTRRAESTTVGASNPVVSASFVMRNKLAN